MVGSSYGKRNDLRVILSIVLLSHPIGHDRKVLFAYDALRRGFKSRLNEVVLGVILVPQIVYKLNEYPDIFQRSMRSDM